MWGRIVIIIALISVLTTCAVSDDPRKGGLFGGLRGLSTGAYDARIKQREAELDRERGVKDDLDRQSGELRKEVVIRDRELASEKQRMDTLETDLSRLEVDVQRLKATSAQREVEVSTLTRKVQTLRQNMQAQKSAIEVLDQSGGTSENPERYRMLQKERDRLAEEYRKLIDYTQALSEAAN